MKSVSLVWIAFGLIACHSSERGNSCPDGGIAPGPGDSQGIPDGSTPTPAGADLAGFVPPNDGGVADAAMNPTASGPIPCGSTSCRGDEACVANTCVYASCTGAKVPGDYASLNEALTALANVGGTICLGAQAFNEMVDVTVTASIAVQGVAAAQTTVTALSLRIPASAPPSNLTLAVRGLAAGNLYFELAGTSQSVLVANAGVGYLATGKQSGGSGEIRVIASKLASASLSDSDGNGGLAFVLDGDEITQPGNASTYVYLHTPASSLKFQNNWVHDASMGLQIAEVMTNSAKVEILNNTFANAGDALNVSGTASQMTVPFAMFNNVFSSNAIAVGLNWTVAAGTTGNNAFFGNTTNYAEYAIAGPGYVTSDPQLTSSSPPGLAVGSPARGTGDPPHAPPADYWGKSRGASVDIGAIQN
jgi:hypothetical protein